MNEQEERIDLFCKKGRHDKVYRVELLKKDGGWIVMGWNARRGAPLKPQPKTPGGPVDYAKAKKIYDELVRSKITGDSGYKPGGDAGSAYSAPSTTEKVDIGIYAEEPVPIKDFALIERYIIDPNYWFQPKHDGENRPLKRDGSKCIGGNKKGFEVPIPDSFKIAMVAFRPWQFVMVSEHIAEEAFVYDLLENGRNYRNEPYERRHGRLTALFESAGVQDRLILIETAKTETEKRSLIERLRREGKEGFVIKDRRGKYTAGESNSQGKYQFRKRAAVIITEVNEKNSVHIHVMKKDGSVVDLCNVTVPAKVKPTLKAGDTIEVSYLFYNPGGGLEIVVFEGKRTDVDAKDCLVDKLVAKGEGDV